MKQCRRCGEVKPLGEFRESRPGYYRPDCKDCILKIKKQYRDNKIDEYRETDRERYTRNRDSIIDVKRRWLDKNKDSVKRSRDKYSDANPEKMKAATRNWRTKNSGLMQFLRDRWNRSNPEKVLQKARDYRGRKRGAQGKFTDAEWKSLLDKYCHRCLACGSRDRLEADHVIPLSKGGSNTIDNIQPLCKHCNSSKGDKVIDYR